ncbi:MAG: hypothetical protein WBM86_08515, partial [Waterburya sp.]
MLLQIKLNKNNLFLAVILIYLGEHFLPLEKTTIKAFISKGFGGQSCFNFPDVRDVESNRGLALFDLEGVTPFFLTLI